MEHAASKLREIARQVAVLKPTFTIPFASYIWFCHEENFYMNDAINRADIVHDYILNKTTSTPVVMFPGEVWSLGGQHASNVAVAAWLQAYENTVGSAHCISPVGLDYDALTAHGRAFADGLLRGNGYAARWFLKPCKVAVHDHKATYLLSVRGLETLPNYAGIADVSLSSDALAYCLKHLWGGATTRINGRYQVPKGGAFDKWRWYFQISELNNHGERFDWGYLAGALWTRLSK
jgi:hypothetical protein